MSKLNSTPRVKFTVALPNESLGVAMAAFSTDGDVKVAPIFINSRDAIISHDSLQIRTPTIPFPALVL